MRDNFHVNFFCQFWRPFKIAAQFFIFFIKQNKNQKFNCGQKSVPKCIKNLFRIIETHMRYTGDG